ncbi:acetyltransferase [Oceanobacillus sp. E9]|uniref:GNAT family N-acetyltransferase n=1 Tax=Oceanobacillus TaxID=182709 RepID=UPI00084EB147|nr:MULTISPECIES: GNAT family N-acetyltransferase [Oceanobacillus]OEH56246.1 acetyltransferase [Oceanobacillus sp. E9]
MTLASKIIETERLTLRPFTLEDAEDVTNLCDNYNIYKTTLHIPYPYTLENAKEWISSHEINRKEDTLYQFAITDKDSGELYGSISLSNRKNHQNGEIAYWLGEEFWGRGFVTEASKAMIQFAFKEKNFHRVFAYHLKINPASGRVMKKCGMTYEGTQKDHIYKDGTFHDLYCYGIVNHK